MLRASTLAAAVLSLLVAASASAQDLRGSGSTFLFPVMTKWVEAYKAAKGIGVDYQPIGSSAGMNEVGANVVDFAVSDAPVVDAQLLRDGLAQFPLAIGGIVPVVNLDGVGPGEMRFTGPLLAAIYLGKITRWDDPALVALNPGIRLPHLPILPVYRSDGSGTSFNWTDYLSRASPEWLARIGANTKVAWPTGAGAKGERGEGDTVAQVKGAIGYVEYGFATRRHLAFGLVRNRSGNFVAPGRESFDAAARAVDVPRITDFHENLADSPAPDAYPIMGMSFALLQAYPKDPVRARATRTFLRWVLENGQDTAHALFFLPLPPHLMDKVIIALDAH